MFRIVVFVVMSFGLLLNVQSQNEAPYLYYYSDVLNAFVIERADGTDSRTLGEGLMPPGTNSVTDTGWSPSGKWFAWRSGIANGYGIEPYSGWLISADGTRRFTFLDTLPNVTEMLWSPVEDLLAIISKDRKKFTLYLIDVEKEKIVKSLEFGFPRNDEAISKMHWSVDGETFSFYYRSITEEWDAHYFFASG